MTPNRKQTNFVNNQPVRFYKIIALTFLLITIVLFAVIIFMSSKRATITITTKVEPIDVTETLIVGPGGTLSGIVTTTLVSVEKTFNPTGTEEEPGIATGKVTLHNETDFNQPLVATTRLMTPDSILFRLKNRVVVPANGSVEAEVYADQEGAGGNIGPIEKFIIPGLSEEKQKVIYASSDSAMSGGIKIKGVLSESDVARAKEQLLSDMENDGRMLLSKLYPDKQALYVVSDKDISVDGEVGTEVSSFTLNGKAEVLGLFYDESEVNNRAKELLQKRVVDEVEILDSKINYVASLGKYDAETGVGELTVVANGQIRLDQNSPSLDKTVFYGKSKDETRRYLLSLDHISEVDINFSPAWMRSVPYVAEHVQVVVKEVE